MEKMCDDAEFDPKVVDLFKADLESTDESAPPVNKTFLSWPGAHIGSQTTKRNTFMAKLSQTSNGDYHLEVFGTIFGM